MNCKAIVEGQKISGLLPFYPIGVVGYLTEQQEAKIAAHLNKCRQCRRKLRLWEGISRYIKMHGPLISQVKLIGHDVPRTR